MKQSVVFLVFISLGTSLFFSESMAQGTLNRTSILLDTHKIALKEIQILGSRPERHQYGQRATTIDSNLLLMMRGASLKDILSQTGPLFVKDYGANGIATPSIRGTSSAHTAVIWNGFQMLSPMNGSTDLALIPNILADEISIKHGSQTALYGSGAVGGAIHLNQKPQLGSGFKATAGTGIGSFGYNRYHVDLSYSKPKWQVRTKLYQQQSEQDYTYKTLLGQEKRLDHAQLRTQAWMQELYLKPHPKHVISFRSWLQNTQRNLPATLSQSNSLADQGDLSTRLGLEHHFTSGPLQWFQRLGYLQENQRFRDPKILLDAQNNFASWIYENELRWTKKQWQTQAGFNYTHHDAFASGYGSQNRYQLRTALFAQIHYESKNSKVKSSLSLRQDLSPAILSLGIQAPFTPALGAQYQLFKFLNFTTSISRTYRVPTLNDLYWAPGGNTSLVPEKGYMADAGLVFKGTKGQHFLEVKTSLYQGQIQDWLLWYPTASYWQAQNIRAVETRGTETQIIHAWKIAPKWSLKTQLEGYYTLSTIVSDEMSNSNTVGKQLIYTPRYQGRFSTELSYKTAWILRYQHQYTGYRFTTSDNFQYLEPYQTAQLFASYQPQFGKFSPLVFIRIQNVYNEVYQVLPDRPMPPTHGELGVQFTFHQPLKPSPL